ncbi:MAG: hypothetical protein AAGG61_02475 [Methanothrix soehngenii]
MGLGGVEDHLFIEPASVSDRHGVAGLCPIHLRASRMIVIDPIDI